MYTKSSIIATLALGTFTFAAPTSQVNVLDKRYPPNVQSCTASDHGDWISYSVDVGALYSTVNCNAVLDAINEPGQWITNWQCVDDMSGGTQLWFNAPPGEGAAINRGLHKVFPAVNGFNCPDY